VEPSGRVCVVTGASSGIGRATALALARRGDRVVAVARREERLRELVAALAPAAPGSFHLAGDLGERAFAERVVREAAARCGRLDVLVNNAAVPLHRLAPHVTADEAEAALRTNFLSCLWTTTAALPIMLRQGGGSIVNVSSVAAQLVPPREGVYAASKAAMSAFTEGLWYDLAGSGIHAALIHAGPIDTEIWEKRQEQSGYAGRRHPPERVAEAVLEAIDRRRFEITVPRRNLALLVARLLRVAAPALLRASMRRMDPVPPGAFATARDVSFHREDPS
jgi:short-subunit dehydrogenase